MRSRQEMADEILLLFTIRSNCEHSAFAFAITSISRQKLNIEIIIFKNFKLVL